MRIETAIFEDEDDPQSLGSFLHRSAAVAGETAGRKAMAGKGGRTPAACHFAFAFFASFARNCGELESRTKTIALNSN
jgi:hypothetical protein